MDIKNFFCSFNKCKNEFLICFCFAFLFLAGCSTVNVRVPYSEVTTPLINEAQRPSLGMSYSPATSFSVSGIDQRPPAFNTESFRSAVTAGEIRYTVVPSLELAGGLIWPSGQGLFDVGYVAKLKIQLIGQQSALMQSPFFLSVFADYKTNNGKASGDQKGLLGPGGYPWRATLNTQTTNYGASMGYFFTSLNLFPFVGYSSSKGEINLKLNQDSNSSSQPDPGGSWERRYDVETRATALGLSYVKENWSIDILHQWNEGTVSKNDLKENTFGFVFNIKIK